jgi:hypothetical protein
MGRIVNATIDVICTSLLFIFLFSACSKKAQTNFYEIEKSDNKTSLELEQGCTARPVASYVAPKNYQHTNLLQDKLDSNSIVTATPFPRVKKSPQVNKSQECTKKDSAIIYASTSYAQVLEHSTTQTSAEPSVLKWFRLLAFLPIAIAVVLMHRIRAKGRRKERETILFGGLISLLIVILLIVLILALV